MKKKLEQKKAFSLEEAQLEMEQQNKSQSRPALPRYSSFYCKKVCLILVLFLDTFVSPSNLEAHTTIAQTVGKFIVQVHGCE